MIFCPSFCFLYTNGEFTVHQMDLSSMAGTQYYSLFGCLLSRVSLDSLAFRRRAKGRGFGGAARRAVILRPIRNAGPRGVPCTASDNAAQVSV